jgi:16S rRNA (uracil1498-N3)-methyltransferase
MSSTPRFFVSPADLRDGVVTLPPDDARHARVVLRLRAGESVLVLDGTGAELDVALTDVGAERVAGQVTGSRPCPGEPRIRVTVAQALPKNADKLEQVLQHGTEVGAAGFVVFGAARSVVRLEAHKLDKRLERWRAIVKGAAEQSRRGVLPSVAWAGDGLAGVATPDGGVCLILHESATEPLAAVLTDAAADAERFTVSVGPEGGFTDDEVAGFVARGGRAVSLGPRVLRTETAALVAVAQLLFAREPVA